MNWLLACFGLCIVSAAMVILPILQHDTLPRRKKLVLSLIIFLALVPGGIALYAWVGVPVMAML